MSSVIEYWAKQAGNSNEQGKGLALKASGRLVKSGNVSRNSVNYILTTVLCM